MRGGAVSIAVEVLLATYNGEKYLEEQLQSLLDQSHADFTVLVADDGSSDATPAILARYRRDYPARFTLLPAANARLGASANFARLVDAASADFVFFCDQDDVWLPDKVEASLAYLRAAIAAYPPATPLLLHSDVTVVDEALAVLGASFFRFAGINPARNSLGALLMGNIATGCTLLVNRPLYEVARPIPRDVLMFDHWLAQVAAALGAIVCLDRPTLLYRQHGGNLIGADRAGTATFAKRVRRSLFSDKTLRVLTSFSRHAQILQERYGERLTPGDRCQVAAMARLWSLPRHRRLASLLRAGLRRPTVVANIGLALLVLRSGRPVRPKRAG